MLKILIIVGTRPEAIKLCPLINALSDSKEFAPIVVSTGQHKDLILPIFKLFGITQDYDLEVMTKSKSLNELLRNCMQGVDRIIQKEKPDAIIVQGDTTSALSGGLCAYYSKIKLVHLEAGLRTYNNYSPYPEEGNRRILSAIADIHLCPTESNFKTLIKEGIHRSQAFITGNTVIDALIKAVEINKKHRSLKIQKINFEEYYELNSVDPSIKIITVTLHRRENHGDKLLSICESISTLSKQFKETIWIIPVHPNPNVYNIICEKLSKIKNIILVKPLGYIDFVSLMNKSYLILTDSGGVQEEAPSLGIPVVVLRDTTERQEAVEAGTVVLVGSDKVKIEKEVEKLILDNVYYKSMAERINPYGNGYACNDILEILKSNL
jgi:UDP-N-acetylglucosamine 2-epimerase (non-hydrolysing)